MRERIVSIPIPAQTENLPKQPEPTLTESLGGKEIPLRRRQARDLIDKMEIPLEQKRLLFFYHLWHETGSFAPIKEFGDIREDPTIDSMLDRVMDSEILAKKYDSFYLEYTDLIDSLREPIARKPKKKVTLSEQEAEERLFQEVGNTNQVFDLKQQGRTNKQIAAELGISLKRTETIVRALIFFKKIAPTPSGEKTVNLQDQFLRQVIDFRLRHLGNQNIALRLGVDLTRVEHAARFLLWLKMIEPIKKADAGKTRWKRKEHKRKIRKLLKTLDKSERVSIRKIHKTCGIDIGYDQFLSLVHELEKEKGVVPPIRKYSRKKSRQQ